MAIVVGIDGTAAGLLVGSLRKNFLRSYDEGMKDSFVRRITRAAGPRALYLRGPATIGDGLIDAVVRGVNHVLHHRGQVPNERVLLTGFSRGAAGVVTVAQELFRRDIPVHAILLFDCVDRHAVLHAYWGPANVAHVRHLRRAPSARSRESFGNAGTGKAWKSPPTAYRETFHHCTHGAVGGTPWNAKKSGKKGSDIIDEGWAPYVDVRMVGWVPVAVPMVDGSTAITYDQDMRESQKVWLEAQPFLREHGFLAGGEAR